MPEPIVRKIANLKDRIVLGTGGGSSAKDFSNNIVSGDINNLFDGDSTTFVEIGNGFGGSTLNNHRTISFDLGKPRTLDRIVLTNLAGNASFQFDIRMRFWIPESDGIFNAATFGYNSILDFNHNSTEPFVFKFTDENINFGGAPYDGNPTSNFKVRNFKLFFRDGGSSTPQNFKDYSQNFKFAGIDIFEQFDTRDFSVEFNDSVLDTQGWQGPRYNGCKTTGQKINVYNAGDITYGQKPNLENKTTALYISNTLVGGREDNQFADIAHHSYINIDKILIIDLDDDSVRILDKANEPFDGFHRFVTTDFPTGGKFSTKLIDEHVQNNLQTSHIVKMNKGWLLKSFSYSAGKGPLPGVDENGNNLSTAPGDPDGYVNAVANPIALYDAVSGAIEQAVPGYPGTGIAGQEGIPGITTAQGPFTTPVAHTFVAPHPYASLGPGFLASGIYGAEVFEDATGNQFLQSNLTGSPNLFTPVENNFTFEFYGTDQPPFTSTYEPKSIGELRFRYGIIQKIDDFAPNTGDEARIFQPLYVGDNTEIIDNKFTRQFVDPSNNQQTDTRLFKLPTIEEVEDIRTDLGLVATKDYKFWGKDKNFNPSVTASVFIGNCVQFLNSHSLDTELHLTLFEGTKDFSGLNDELSISTFEVDKNLDPAYLSFEENIGPLTKTIGPRSRYIRLKNQPQFKPTVPLASFTTVNLSTPGSPITTINETGTDRFVYDVIETDQFRCNVSERQNAFVFGPGTTNTNLDPDCGLTTAVGFPADYDNSPNNSQNFSGSFKYELSFLDKDHTLIADLDKPAELFDGIGGNGVVLIPEHTHEMVKINLEYYLEKAGLVNKTTVKKFINSND
tara:strand:+ start:13613 stop:16147 length:2535 start_codon:yes stop_codon:yes gene_type:complete